MYCVSSIDQNFAKLEILKTFIRIIFLDNPKRISSPGEKVRTVTCQSSMRIRFATRNFRYAVKLYVFKAISTSQIGVNGMYFYAH